MHHSRRATQPNLIVIVDNLYPLSKSSAAVFFQPDSHFHSVRTSDVYSPLSSSSADLQQQTFSTFATCTPSPTGSYSMSGSLQSTMHVDGDECLSACTPSTSASSIIASHYRVVRPLLQTIFGRTLLCEDVRGAPVFNNNTSCKRDHPAYVVVKESSSAQTAQTQKESDAVIGEDMYKEARVLRFLGRQASSDNQATFSLTQAHIDRNTCGLSDAFWTRHADPVTGKLSTDAILDLNKGAEYIPLLFGEQEQNVCAYSDSNRQSAEATAATPSKVHYLVSEYASQGDLHGLITNAPNERLDETQARQIFRQLLLAVRYAHARSVVHLDISCENVCIMENGDARLIDWGPLDNAPALHVCICWW
jgi:hypothetical protein